jgi:hypothetical protein
MALQTIYVLRINDEPVGYLSNIYEAFNWTKNANNRSYSSLQIAPSYSDMSDVFDTVEEFERYQLFKILKNEISSSNNQDSLRM